MYIPNSLLRRHVLESNRIERIRIRSGLPLYTSHFTAAHMVARHPQWELPLHPCEIHRVLAQGTEMDSFAGTYRRQAVWVGGRKMPRWEAVPALMTWWWKQVTQYANAPMPSSVGGLSGALFLHSLFLCIHPFADGNGRTARLVLNTLRLRRGLPWMVVSHEDVLSYYRHIRQVEDLRIIQEQFPDAYDPER